ncbi:MAG: hypothetical protein A2504_01305 [Bdellovibrionales bacterium RIFOXYD12_FULL_39_22]|nr:MAG: hypothetical protein A2385_02195 [Bdellovibrionales bacterium RIFOXYB1_FULL_39_21]OFZ42745.1 MAG: hypothetical protein A2485_10380 [Bdellovibrionales bacterium RIFOXYC12_FULL_39_17]OFZ47304.1 MAG: hypothetical protein A2404_14985 [Bdellovibrionales bacterium RIFOXYC1_FULL_39_130]OFZ75470.1 MAG: hypothetical protein A2560_04255 [Bdellovibrionales bacterium RIFOXYD1_FULL_39_84]OFZ93424.1 MAG: hypothetical protein A2504_01305 [Bdellovibrionales bacterium RIFOXYD12_FULL_39_22]HLE12396.1 cy
MTKMFFYALVFAAMAAQTMGKDVAFESLFKKSIIGPSLLTVCDGKLWVYSVGEGKFIVLTASGEMLKTYGVKLLGVSEKVTAMSCREQEVIFATLNGQNKAELYLLDGGQAKKLNYVVEDQGHIHTIACQKESCLIGHKNFYISADLKRWKQLNLMSTAAIPLAQADKDLNPFVDWQRNFELSKDNYSRAVITDLAELYLLDPFQGSVLLAGKLDKGAFVAESVTAKWGKWGAWEGQLMYPKAIKYWKKHDLLVFADVGLKHIFFFGKDGEYFGKLGVESADLAEMNYPLDVAMNDNYIYIADFLSNIVWGVDLTKFEKSPDVIPAEVEDYFHRNLFKNERVNAGFSKVRCLNCHDGLEVYSLDNFVKARSHHPLDVEVAKGVDLPLWLGKYISCATCHTQHHVPLEGRSYTQTGKENKVEKLPHNLRREYRQLCTTCHQDKTETGNNHLDLNLDMRSSKAGGVKVVSCSQCHEMHRASEKLLVGEDSAVCVSCHGPSHTPVSHPFGAVNACMSCHNPDKRPSTHPVLPETAHFADQLANKKIQCFSCHKMHNSSKADYFPRKDDKGRDWSCLNCHQTFAAYVGTNAHLISYGGPTGVPCMKCHNPHDKEVKNITVLCTRCHVDRKQQHRKIPAMERYGADNVRLKNSEIVCSTCHQQHGLSKNEKFLRDKNVIASFCASCHADEAPRLFENFHNKLRR